MNGALEPTYFNKISSPYKREMVSKKRGVFTREFADPRFEELYEDEFQFFYKWDGTSVGVLYTAPDRYRIFGRTPRTVMPDWQAEAVEAWACGDGSWDRTQAAATAQHGELHYGELIGPKVQGNPHQLERLQVRIFAWSPGDGKPPRPWGLWGMPFTLAEVVEEFRKDGGQRFRSEWPEAAVYWEGMVGYHEEARLWCKIKNSDVFGW